MKFDETFLQEMGLTAMPVAEKHEFLSYVKDELEVRIGERISDKLSEAELAEFDAIEDRAVATKWLEGHCPDYRAIVEQTIDEIKSEILANRNKLVA